MKTKLKIKDKIVHLDLIESFYNGNTKSEDELQATYWKIRGNTDLANYYLNKTPDYYIRIEYLTKITQELLFDNEDIMFRVYKIIQERLNGLVDSSYENVI